MNNLRELAVDCKDRDIDFDDISPNQGSTSCDKLVRAFIAAASPDVVLGLLDEIERLRVLLRSIADNSTADDWPNDIMEAIEKELK